MQKSASIVRVLTIDDSALCKTAMIILILHGYQRNIFAFSEPYSESFENDFFSKQSV